jgi:hypothetical protein
MVLHCSAADQGLQPVLCAAEAVGISPTSASRLFLVYVISMLPVHKQTQTTTAATFFVERSRPAKQVPPVHGHVGLPTCWYSRWGFTARGHEGTLYRRLAFRYMYSRKLYGTVSRFVRSHKVESRARVHGVCTRDHASNNRGYMNACESQYIVNNHRSLPPPSFRFRLICRCQGTHLTRDAVRSAPLPSARCGLRALCPLRLCYSA